MKKFFKFGCLGIIGIFVLGLVVTLISGEDSDNSTPVSSKNNSVENEGAKEDKKVKEEKKAATIGEELQVEKVGFKVNSIEEVTQITAGNGMFKYTPDAEGAVFLVVNVTVKNGDTEMIQTDSSFFKLKAESGADYSPSTIFVADDKYFAYEGINPGLALTGNVLFEVPSGLTGLELQVQTGFWGTETGVIKLN